MAFLEEYTLLDELGQGGYATVYKVRHNNLGYSIERGGNSVNAKKMVKKVVLPILEPSTKIHEKAYIDEL